MPDADVEVMHDVSDYIVWMGRSERELSFDITGDELARAKISDGRKVYKDLGANEVLYHVMNYKLFQQFIEFIDILSEEIYWQHAPNFTEYFKTDAHTVFPKYILYSGHNTNNSALLRGFDKETY